jgi:predicted CoA-binding protein
MNYDKKLVEELSQYKKICVVGVSRKRKFGNEIYYHLKQVGYIVTAVNPNMSEIGVDKCYPNLESIPDKPELVLIAVKSSSTIKILEECSKLNINRVFLVRMSYNNEVIEFCKKNNIRAVYGSCPFMHFNTSGFHKFHRLINRIFSIKPKTV